MTARSINCGWPIEHRDDAWVYSDTGCDAAESRACRNCNRRTVPVNVRISADLSCTGTARKRDFQIDACLAPLVEALQERGINMRSSCCGHGKAEGEITLEDGRVLLVLGPQEAADYLKWVRKDRNLRTVIEG